MKKIIIAIVAVAVVAACAAGAYFAFFNNSDENAPELSIVKGEMIESVGYIEACIKNPDRFKPRLAKEYQLSEEQVNDFFAAPEEWLTYGINIEIQNIGENDLTAYSFEIKDNGKKGVYVSSSLGGELGLPVGSNPALASLSILCSDIELSADEIREIVDSMDISVVYTKTPAEYDDGTESIEETKLAAIKDTAE